MIVRGLTPSRRVHPPMMITNAIPAVTSSRKTTRALALFASGFSLFGRQSSYPGRMAPASIAGQVYGLDWIRATPNRRPAAMRAEGLEPPRSFEHRHLKPACIPIPPRPRAPSILVSGQWELRMCRCAGTETIAVQHPGSPALQAVSTQGGGSDGLANLGREGGARRCSYLRERDMGDARPGLAQFRCSWSTTCPSCVS